MKRVWGSQAKGLWVRLDFGLGFLNKVVAGVGGVGIEVVKATKKSHIISSATERRNTWTVVLDGWRVNDNRGGKPLGRPGQEMVRGRRVAEGLSGNDRRERHFSGGRNRVG